MTSHVIARRVEDPTKQSHTFERGLLCPAGLAMMGG